jgi:hypothetical protein
LTSSVSDAASQHEVHLDLSLTSDVSLPESFVPFVKSFQAMSPICDVAYRVDQRASLEGSFLSGDTVLKPFITHHQSSEVTIGNFRIVLNLGSVAAQGKVLRVSLLRLLPGSGDRGHC